MTAAKKNMHYGWVIVIMCCLIMGVNIGIAFSCAGIFYSPVSESLGVKVGVFGLYMSIMYVASTVMLPAAGQLIEKFSARWLLTGCSAVMGLTYIAMAFFTQVWEFYVAAAVLGVTIAFLLYLSFPTLINRWFNKRVGLLMGVCAAASGVGGILLNPVGAWLITDFGWHVAYGIFGALILLVCSPLYGLLLRDRPEDKGLLPFGGEAAKTKAGTPAEGKTCREALRTPTFYALMLFSLLMMAVSTLNLFIPGFALSEGFDLEQASFAAAAVMVGVTLGKLALGHINDRNCLLGVLLTTLGGAIGIALLLITGAGLWPLIGGAFLFGWAYAGVMVQTAMLTRGMFGARDYARIYSFVSVALAIGGAVASGAWGFLVDAMSYRFIFILGTLALALCAVLGVWCLAASQKKIEKITVPD